MPRLLAPTLAVLFLAALIGCGGGGTGPSFDQDPDTTGTTSTIPTTSGNTNGGTVDLRPAAGTYSVAVAGTVGSTAVTGSGTAVVASDGTVNVTLPAASSSDSTARAAHVVVAKDGSANGTLSVGTSSAVVLTTATLSQPSTGGYLLTLGFTNTAAVVETYRLTLTVPQTTFVGPNAGTDDRGGTYTGTGTAKLSAGNVLDLTYTSIRPVSGVSSLYTHRIVTTLAAGGTFSGSLDLGTQDKPAVPATGTWSLSGNTLTVTLKYENTNFVIPGGTSPSPNATETLTLTKQ